MWIKREKYETLTREAAVTEHLRREVDYWRGKFEDEKSRADRIGDRVFEIEGRPPVSTVGMAEARVTAKEMAAEVKRRMDEMGAFEEDDTSEFIVDERIKIEPGAAVALGVK
jgi:bacterioferritin (cytochrome b1)